MFGGVHGVVGGGDQLVRVGVFGWDGGVADADRESQWVAAGDVDGRGDRTGQPVGQLRRQGEPGGAGESTVAARGGGSARSSGEASVIGVERRGRPIDGVGA